MNCKTEKMLYYSLVYPHLNYGILLWGSTYITHIERLLVLQKKAVRIISTVDWNEHTPQMFKELNLLQLEHMYNYSLGNFMFSQYIRLSPCQIPHLFVQNSDIHSHYTRYASYTHMQYRRTVLVSNSLMNAGPRYWDSLSDNMKEVHSIDHFKYVHKKYIVRTMSLP